MFEANVTRSCASDISGSAGYSFEKIEGANR